MGWRLATAYQIPTSVFVALAGSKLSVADEIWSITSLSKISKKDLAIGFVNAHAFLEQRNKSTWAESFHQEATALQETLKKSGLESYKKVTNQIQSIGQQASAPLVPASGSKSQPLIEIA